MELVIFIPTVSFAILLSAFLGCYSVITAFKQQQRHPDSQSVAGMTAVFPPSIAPTEASLRRRVSANHAAMIVKQRRQ